MTPLELVDASPAAVARGDLEGWLALFAPTAVIEDPVGTAPARGHDGIARFYRGLVHGVDVAVVFHGDFFGEGAVVRHVTLSTGHGAGLPRFEIPAVLEYRVADGRIMHLRAHWDLRRVLGWYRRLGLRAAWVGGRQMLRLTRHLGLRGLWGFARGLLWPRARAEVPGLVARTAYTAAGVDGDVAVIADARTGERLTFRRDGPRQ